MYQDRFEEKKQVNILSSKNQENKFSVYFAMVINISEEL
jgi:hypothetical protein